MNNERNCSCRSFDNETAFQNTSAPTCGCAEARAEERIEREDTRDTCGCHCRCRCGCNRCGRERTGFFCCLNNLFNGDCCRTRSSSRRCGCCRERRCGCGCRRHWEYTANYPKYKKISKNYCIRAFHVLQCKRSIVCSKRRVGFHPLSVLWEKEYNIRWKDRRKILPLPFASL